MPVDLGAYSSRETLMVGNMCLAAARKLATMVRASLADEFELPVDRIRLAKGWAFDVCEPTKRLPIAQAFALAEAKHGTLGATGLHDAASLLDYKMRRSRTRPSWSR